MREDYYTGIFEDGHNYGEEVEIVPGTSLCIPAKANIRAVIEGEFDVALPEDLPFKDDFTTLTPAVFWDENLVYSRDGTYVFETKYCRPPLDALPSCSIEKIPGRIRERFTGSVPPQIQEISNEAVGDEMNTLEVLNSLMKLVHEGLKPRMTRTRDLKDVVDEYRREGEFRGNCKEASDFLVSLYRSQGFPAKSVFGKPFYSTGGHLWADVVVPTEEGYEIIPADPSIDKFGDFDRRYNVFFERSPGAYIDGSENEDEISYILTLEKI